MNILHNMSLAARRAYVGYAIRHQKDGHKQWSVYLDTYKHTELVLRYYLLLLKYKLSIAVMQGEIKIQNFAWHPVTNIPRTVANIDDADRNQHEICSTHWQPIASVY